MGILGDRVLVHMKSQNVMCEFHVCLFFSPEEAEEYKIELERILREALSKKC